ncbi:MAG: hypothetical protein AAF944_06385 [Bacteroidota bacterium]
MIYTSRWFMRDVYTYRDSLTNSAIGKKFNLRFRDLHLLMAARIWTYGLLKIVKYLLRRNLSKPCGVITTTVVTENVLILAGFH